MRFFLPLLSIALLLSPALRAEAPRVSYNVRDYGAVGDGKKLDTPALNAAVTACAAGGGGTVYIPPGNYLTGTVVLKSHVTLELDAGAKLLGSEDPADYPSTPSVWGDGGTMMAPLIYAVDGEHI